jgi:hypothetical protein
MKKSGGFLINLIAYHGIPYAAYPEKLGNAGSFSISKKINDDRKNFSKKRVKLDQKLKIKQFGHLIFYRLTFFGKRI